VLEPREHLVPDPAFLGHFNLLRAYVAALGVAGVKVVGDYVDNWKLGLPTELAIVTLYDPRSCVPLAIVDATEITERLTGALTALGAKYLARRDTRILGHVGARGTAFSNVAMLDNLFDFEESA
jgi:alanine dehydrogenase